VKEENFESTFAEPVLIRPTVHKSLQSDSSVRAFDIRDGEIDSSSFGAFLKFIRCRDSVSLPKDPSLSHLSICRLLGNEGLAFLLLAYMKSDFCLKGSLISDSNSSSQVELTTFSHAFPGG
jgi:hypothetical protein